MIYQKGSAVYRRTPLRTYKPVNAPQLAEVTP